MCYIHDKKRSKIQLELAAVTQRFLPHPPSAMGFLEEVPKVIAAGSIVGPLVMKNGMFMGDDYPLVNVQKTMENHHFSMGTSTISMAIFNS